MRNYTRRLSIPLSPLAREKNTNDIHRNSNEMHFNKKAFSSSPFKRKKMPKHSLAHKAALRRVSLTKDIRRLSSESSRADYGGSDDDSESDRECQEQLARISKNLFLPGKPKPTRLSDNDDNEDDGVNLRMSGCSNHEIKNSSSDEESIKSPVFKIGRNRFRKSEVNAENILSGHSEPYISQRNGNMTARKSMYTSEPSRDVFHRNLTFQSVPKKQLKENKRKTISIQTDNSLKWNQSFLERRKFNDISKLPIEINKTSSVTNNSNNLSIINKHSENKSHSNSKLLNTKDINEYFKMQNFNEQKKLTVQHTITTSGSSSIVMTNKTDTIPKKKRKISSSSLNQINSTITAVSGNTHNQTNKNNSEKSIKSNSIQINNTSFNSEKSVKQKIVEKQLSNNTDGKIINTASYNSAKVTNSNINATIDQIANENSLSDESNTALVKIQTHFNSKIKDFQSELSVNYKKSKSKVDNKSLIKAVSNKAVKNTSGKSIELDSIQRSNSSFNSKNYSKQKKFEKQLSNRTGTIVDFELSVNPNENDVEEESDNITDRENVSKVTEDKQSIRNLNPVILLTPLKNRVGKDLLSSTKFDEIPVQNETFELSPILPIQKKISVNTDAYNDLIDESPVSKKILSPKLNIDGIRLINSSHNSISIVSESPVAKISSFSKYSKVWQPLTKPIENSSIVNPQISLKNAVNENVENFASKSDKIMPVSKKKKNKVKKINEKQKNRPNLKRNISEKHDKNVELYSLFDKATLSKMCRKECGIKLPDECLDNVAEFVELVFNQIVNDVEAYASHAGRETVNVNDYFLLAKRIGLINKKVSELTFCERYLEKPDILNIFKPIVKSSNEK